jgi:hypothetical protein
MLSFKKNIKNIKNIKFRVVYPFIGLHPSSPSSTSQVFPSAVVVYRILNPYDRLQYNHCIGVGSLPSWAMVINARTKPRVKNVMARCFLPGFLRTQTPTLVLLNDFPSTLVRLLNPPSTSRMPKMVNPLITHSCTHRLIMVGLTTLSTTTKSVTRSGPSI